MARCGYWSCMHVRVVNTHITTNHTTPRQIFTLKFSCTCDISLQRWEDMRRAMCAEKALDNLDLVICYNIASCYPLIIFFFFQTATNYRWTVATLNQAPVYWITTLCLQTWLFHRACHCSLELFAVVSSPNVACTCRLFLLISLYSVNYTHFVFSIWQYISAYIVPLLFYCK